MPDFIHIHPDDNVAVALHAIPAGTVFAGIHAAQDIPQGHKMALKAITEGEQVVKYGFSINTVLWDRVHAVSGIAAKKRSPYISRRHRRPAR